MIPQKDRIEAAIRHIQTSLDIDPWAMELAVEALKAQIDKDTNVPNNDDIISRQAALERLQHSKPEVGADGSKERYRRLQWIADCNAIEEVPSAQPEERTEKRTETHACDLISRAEALACFHSWMDKHGDIHEPDEIPEYRAIEALPERRPNED